MMTQRDPLLLCRALAPLRLEGVGSLECARWAATGQRVCLRKVPASPAALEAIEAALLLPRHPALAAPLDAGVWKGDAWLVTDFPDGALLGEVSDKPRTPHALASDFGPVLEALAALHAHGSAHGLLSGEALLLEPSGKLVLHEVAMLALNRVTDRRPEQTLLAQLQRTAAYFSPQRLKGCAPTAADDVYALGALLCFAAGGPRLTRPSALEQLHAVMVGEWRPAPPAGLPASLVRLLERMTAREASLRPSASEAAQVLRSFVPRVIEPLIPHPLPTAPGVPVFELLPAPAPTAPYASLSGGQLIAPPPARPTIPSAPPAHAPIQLGGAAAPETLLGSLSRRFTGFTVSIAASDARLITAGLLALGMLSSTVALGAHVLSSREEAVELAAAQVVKPVPPREPRYTADQLKQILRQKEAARHEY